MQHVPGHQTDDGLIRAPVDAMGGEHRDLNREADEQECGQNQDPRIPCLSGDRDLVFG